MKIYNSITLSPEGAVLQEDSFEYNGPVALLGGGGSTPKPPQPTTAEQEIATQQARLARLSGDVFEELTPTLLEELGYTREVTGTFGETEEFKSQISSMESQMSQLQQQLQDAISGQRIDQETGQSTLDHNRRVQSIQLQMLQLTQKMTSLRQRAGAEETEIRRLSEEEALENMSPLERTRYETEKFSAERTLAYAQGEDIVSPEIERAFARERANVNAQLIRTMGPGFRESSAGQRALFELGQSQNLARQDIRTSELGLLQGTGSEAQRQRLTQKGFTLQGLSSVAGGPIAVAGGMGGVLEGLRGERYSTYSADVARYNAQQQARAQNISTAGAVVGTAATIGIAI